MNIDKLGIKTEVFSQFKELLPEGVAFCDSLERLWDSSILYRSFLWASKDVLCAIIFWMRCMETISKPAFESRDSLVIRSLWVELSLWTRKTIEHLIKAIIFEQYTDEELKLVLACDSLQFCLKNKQNFKEMFPNISKEEPSEIAVIRTKISESPQLKNISNIIDLGKVKKSWTLSIIRPIFEQYAKATDLWNWHERLLLWKNYEVAYGNPSSQIHANNKLHEKEFSNNNLLSEVEILWHIQKLLLIRLQKKCDIKSGLNMWDESESELAYKELWMKEFEAWDLVVDTRFGETLKIVKKVEDLEIKFKYTYEIKTENSTYICSSVYLKKLS